MRLKAENYQLLADLHSECFPHRPWGADDFAELQKSGAEIIQSQNSFLVWRAAADQAEVITIGVRPNARRVGLANILLAFMEKDLSKRGIKKVFLEVAIDNIPAISLYKKNGFVRVGVRPKYYDGKDAVIMEKTI